MKRVLCIVGLALLVVGSVSADSLAVNGTAALEGSYGLAVTHNNASVAYVQDNTPVDETVYRATWLFNPNSMSGNLGNFRQTIFLGLDQNPNPSSAYCGTGVYSSSVRCFVYFTGGLGQIANFQCFAAGNLCGERAGNIARLPISMTAASRVCLEYSIGAGTNGGRIAYWAGDAATNPTCPTSGTAGWSVGAVTNSLFTGLDIIRMGTPQTNNFGVGESGTMYFDSFESYRTLAP